MRTIVAGEPVADNARFSRTAGLWCIAGALITVVGGVFTASIPSAVPANSLSNPYTPGVFRVTQVLWAISHALMFLGTLGFARTDAVGTARLGPIGRWLALVGMAAIVPCQPAFAFAATETEESAPGMVISSAIGLATMAAALGFLLAGVAALRAGRWHGWHRFAPLSCGLVPFAGLLPTLIFAPDYFLWPLTAWSATFVLLGLALSRQGATSRHASLSATPA